FGDPATPPCRICDNCRRPKGADLTPEEFNAIATSITTRLQQAPLHAHELFEQLQGVQKEKARRVLDFLQAEQKIAVNGQGQMTVAP
ncbi:MAG TPA: RecQ family ATP-dependent DNA helicase, partial [Chitinophagaceae bacterium]